VVTRFARSTLGIAALVAAVAAPRSARADLRLHADVTGSTPLDNVLFADAGPGISVGGSVDYEVVNLLAVGLFYSFTNFIDAEPEADEEVAQSIFDHAVGGRLDLRFVRHRTAGWFGRDTGRAYGEAFISLDLAFHYLGLQPRLGWAVALGYRVVAAGPFGFGPYFRFNHVVAGFTEETSRSGHQMYVSFGLELFLTFDLTRGDDEPDEERSDDGGAAGQGGSTGGDDWSEFEAVSEEE
jgi:hypothetical protein